jgi:hypothetical protein
MQGKNENNEEKVFGSVWEIFLNYTEDSTIQGLMYIFLPYQVNKQCLLSPWSLSSNL